MYVFRVLAASSLTWCHTYICVMFTTCVIGDMEAVEPMNKTFYITMSQRWHKCVVLNTVQDVFKKKEPMLLSKVSHQSKLWYRNN